MNNKEKMKIKKGTELKSKIQSVGLESISSRREKKKEKSSVIEIADFRV